jgi:hypothetical protein
VPPQEDRFGRQVHTHPPTAGTPEIPRQVSDFRGQARTINLQWQARAPADEAVLVEEGLARDLQHARTVPEAGGGGDCRGNGKVSADYNVSIRCGQATAASDWQWVVRSRHITVKISASRLEIQSGCKSFVL